jgi:hypothetical protein
VLQYNITKLSAKKRGYVFDLSFDRFVELTSTPCAYCGEDPRQVRYAAAGSEEAREHAKYVYNGIDRINNNYGYIEGNCAPCCKYCNWAKMDKSLEDFIKWVNALKTNFSVSFQDGGGI